MTAIITALRPKDQVFQDAEPVAALYRDLGTIRAEQEVTRLLAELALTMSSLTDRVRLRDLHDLSRQLRLLEQRSEQLGLVSLALVAGDVRICLQRADTTAFAAVWARLLRVAECCLIADPGAVDHSH